jgi:hypothetical protein
MTGVGTEELTQRYSGRRRESRQGSMRSRRTITLTTACLLTLSLSAALPAAAPAGSLLSGYGGPGQGSQEIIGASLVNGGNRGGGPSGGGSSGGSAGAVGSPTAATTGIATGTSPAAARSLRSRPGKRAARAARRAQRSNGQVGSVAGSTKTYPALSPAAAVQAVPGGSSALGLSSRSLLYIALALVALILTAVFTRLLVRPAQRVGTGG